MNPAAFRSTGSDAGKARAITLAAVMTATGAVAAAGGPPAPTWRMSLVGGGLNQFETSIDSGGGFDSRTLFVQVGATRPIGTAWTAGLTLDYAEDRYDFSGNSGFGALNPWEHIRRLQFGVPIRYRAGDSWTLFGLPSLRYAAESGASLSDGHSWGLLAGAAYRMSESLTIGPGFGVFSDIEDSDSVFPILLVDWTISDTLNLKTGSGLEASRGPGVTLTWDPAGQWRFGLSTRYEQARFRLDDDGPAPDGVGEDRSVPVALTARYSPHRDVELTLVGGVEFAGRLRLEDANGGRIDDSDYETAPFAGAFARLSF